MENLCNICQITIDNNIVYAQLLGNWTKSGALKYAGYLHSISFEPIPPNFIIIADVTNWQLPTCDVVKILNRIHVYIFKNFVIKSLVLFCNPIQKDKYTHFIQNMPLRYVNIQFITICNKTELINWLLKHEPNPSKTIINKILGQ